MKRPSGRSYPVESEHSFWENVFSRNAYTRPRLVALIDEVAAINGRAAHMDEEVDLDLDIEVTVVTDSSGLTSLLPITRVRRAVALAHDIQRTIRQLIRADAARIIKKVDRKKGESGPRRRIVIKWDRQTKSVAAQIKALNRAVRSGSAYRIEAARFALTPRAQDYLAVGFEIARRVGKLEGYKGELSVSATLISLPMMAPDLLRRILPYAILAAALPGRRPVHPRDEALAALLTIYNEVSGSTTGSARLGGLEEPTGPGADFVRNIEKLFGVQLLAPRSTHAVARAKRRMAKPHDR